MIERIKLEQFSAEAITKYGVVCIDLDKQLSPEELVNLSKKIGIVQPFGLSKYRPSNYPAEVTLLDNLGDGVTAATRQFGEGWHQDSSFLSNAPEYTILHSLEVPADGGDTHFADTRLAWGRVASNKKELFRKIELRHAVLDSYRLMPSDVGKNLGDILSTLPSTTHELVKTVHGAGEVLYISPLYTKSHVSEENRDYYESLLNEIMKDSKSHTWKSGQILAWDNRVVLHAASGYDGNQRRKLIRTVVKSL